MNRNTSLLFLLVLTAFITRVFVIWIGRPEFVGWFNHTYYYYVETEGLLSHGKLPFPDMPLLFYIYAFTAKIFTYLGADMHHAIVNSTRFWMSLIPSILPIAVYFTFKGIYRSEAFPKWIWGLIFISAFYPLSLLYMPEFLQKNVLGILLLALLIQQSRNALEGLHAKRIILLVLTFLLIVLTHYGTTAAALLYASAFLFAYGWHKRSPSKAKLSLALFAGISFALGSIYLFDYQRFERIIFYINRMADTSSLGLIFSSDGDKLSAILMALIPLAAVLLLYQLYKKAKPALSYENSVFWLCNIIFCYLLMLPVYDPLLFARFANYLILPLLFVVAFVIQYSLKKAWMKKAVLGFALLGTLTIAAGDISSRMLRNKNKGQIYQDIVKMKEANGLSPNDLIIARNGAEHISNWFLQTKSCVITSFNLNDFEKYDRIFILNPTEGSMALPANTSEAIEKYSYMLSNIREPQGAQLVYESPHIRLLELESAPGEWSFDEQGKWIGY